MFLTIKKNVFLAAIVLLLTLKVAAQNSSILYFQPNTTELFTELYKAYGLENLPSLTHFEEAIYLDQSTPGAILPLQPSNQVIFEEASNTLMAFHKKVGDFELYVDPLKPPPFFYTTVGSKQLITALVYAIVSSNPQKNFLFVEKSPFFSGHPDAVSGFFTYPNARFQAFHHLNEIHLQPGEELIEFVTSPNNPDGKFRMPVTEANIIIADFVFASSVFGNDGTGYLQSNIDWIQKARASGKHVFSFNSASKQFGKTGARCGYMWYPMHDPYAKSIFSKFFRYISASTVGGGTIGLAHFLDLIKAFLKMSDAGESLRQDARKTLIQRHSTLEKELLTKYPGSTVISIPGSANFFVKIHDPRIPKMKASDVLLADLNIFVNSGDTMGETNEFVRFNLCGKSESFKELLNRLTKR